MTNETHYLVTYLLTYLQYAVVQGRRLQAIYRL